MHGSMRRGLETERPDHGHWGGATDRETGGHEGPRPYRQDPPPRQPPTLPRDSGRAGQPAGCHHVELYL